MSLSPATPARHAALRELGPVTVIADPGRSGKDTNRPGLQQLLEAVDRGHVSNILIWRLDRLSRSLGDLIELADLFGRSGVGLYSFTEQLDLSSATGRMQFNILGTFAQFYREQLAENVKMGTAQAARQGKWMNRPKTGYSLVDGELVPNDDASIVRRIFRLRASGQSYRDIEAVVGVKYSTVRAILLSRIYLGEVLHAGQWYPGRHEPLVTPEEFRAAALAHSPGVRRSRDILSGRVGCGLCGRLAAVQYNQDGSMLYRCHHRGSGCKQPGRTARGLLRAALLGLRLIGTDTAVQTAIRDELRRSGRRQAKRRSPSATSSISLGDLSRKRQKLLDLYYSEAITAEYFKLEEERLTIAIAAATEEASLGEAIYVHRDELEVRFEEVAAVLANLDIDRLWAAATDVERRTLIEELLERVLIFPDHLEVTVAGAPRLNVTLSEVGLKESRTVGVGGGT